MSFQDRRDNTMVHRHFGIDMGKPSFQVCFLFKFTVVQKTFSNDEAGWNELIDWARQLCPKAILRFCVEHTGGYETGLVAHLQAQGLYVSVVDSERMFHFRRSLGKKGKSDPGDAYCLAKYSRERMPEAWCPRPNPFVAHMQLCRARDGFVEQLTTLRNRASAPNVLAVVREQLDMLIAVVKHAIENVEAKMAEIEATTTELGEAVQILRSIKGVELTSARQIVSEMGPISSYPTPEKLALSAGLVPLVRKSGTSLGKTELFPYGNQKLRSAAYRVALVAKRHDPAFKAFAERIKSHGHKSKKTIITACARKLMHVVWALLTYKTSYDPQLLMKQARLT